MKEFNLQEYLAQHPVQNMAELQLLLREAQLLQNNAPRAAFLGLSSNQMHSLLYAPFAEGSASGFLEATNSDLDQVPFFRLCEAILACSVLQKSPFKMTAATSSLPVKVVKMVYEKGIIKDAGIEKGLFPLYKESDVESIHVAKLCLEMAGVVRKAKGSWHLTKKGAKLTQPGQRNALFQAIFLAFATTYNWAYLDGYYELDPQLGRLALPFSLAMFVAFGHEARSHTFYADLYIQAFPTFLPPESPREWATPQKYCASCYSVRVFSRFAYWFGLMEVVTPGGILNRNAETTRKTPLLERLFRLPELTVKP
jgi:hypothetical protein